LTTRPRQDDLLVRDARRASLPRRALITMAQSALPSIRA